MGPAAEQLIFFVLLGVAGWLLLVRPQRRRAKALQEVRDAVHVGSRVITTAGLHATVAAVEDDTLLLEIAPGVQARFAKQAVVGVRDSTDEPASAQRGAPPAA
ncbi:MAG: preprotein translocase subunit YajC [Frankiaceae bacterium]|nr:preprotein translocase subunit YajC [Frankiaceae bacterium]